MKVNSFAWIIKDLEQEIKLNEFRIIPVVTIPIIPVWILSQPYRFMFIEIQARKGSVHVRSRGDSRID